VNLCCTAAYTAGNFRLCCAYQGVFVASRNPCFLSIIPAHSSFVSDSNATLLKPFRGFRWINGIQSNTVNSRLAKDGSKSSEHTIYFADASRAAETLIKRQNTSLRFSTPLDLPREKLVIENLHFRFWTHAVKEFAWLSQILRTTSLILIQISRP